MNENIKFRSLEDLYNRILPALRSKAKELHKNGLTYIHEEDIWNYLKIYKWSVASNLDLGCMVNDIFNLNQNEIRVYVSNIIKEYHRKGNLELDERKNNYF